MPRNTAQQDAATDLLIAQLISADLDAPVLDPIPTFPSLHAEDLFPEANNNNNTNEPPPVPLHERQPYEMTADEFEVVFRSILESESFAAGWPAAEGAAQAMAHGEREQNGFPPVMTPSPEASADLNRSSIGSSSRTAAPISSSGGEGSSRLQQDETVWWTPRGGNGKARATEEAELDESESESESGSGSGSGDQEEDENDYDEDDDEEEDYGRGYTVLFDAEDEEESEDAETKGKDAESERKDEEEGGFMGETYRGLDEARGGIVYIPSPGERRVSGGDRSGGEYARELYYDTHAEVVLGEDETFEGILNAMVLLDL